MVYEEEYSVDLDEYLKFLESIGVDISAIELIDVTDDESIISRYEEADEEEYKRCINNLAKNEASDTLKVFASFFMHLLFGVF